ncbi:MAG: Rpn family recombination-promoting nuclease/putative transposase [Pseudanabaena sp.]
MKTDTLFYQLFQSFHTLLFELIDRPIADAEGYQFTTAEIKEKAFRFDGIFIPTTDDKPIFFIEVQFQPKNDFYWEYLSEIFLYLNQYRPSNKWQAVAIFAKRNCEPEIVDHVQEMIDSNRIIRVYLEDWVRQETNSLTIAIIQLILAPENKASKLARQINNKVQQEPNTDLQDQVVKFIETVLVYKFPKLNRQEIEAMFTFNDLKNTRVYQDAKQEGLQLGKQEGLQRQVAMLLRMLTRKFGKLSPRTKNRITKLSVTQLENLAEVIFDLQTVADLNTWLRNNG